VDYKYLMILLLGAFAASATPWLQNAYWLGVYLNEAPTWTRGCVLATYITEKVVVFYLGHNEEESLDDFVVKELKRSSNDEL
jgi:hypothetical protein